MADPTEYEPGYSYSDFESNNPTTPKPGPQLDNDFAEIALSVNDTIAALKDVRRSDGALKNQIVTLDSLAPDVNLLLNVDPVFAAQIATVAGLQTEIEVVVSIEGEIVALYGIRDNITALANIEDEMLALYGIRDNITSLDAIKSEMLALYGIRTDITTLSPIAAEISTLAPLAGAIATLAPISADITTVATIAPAVVGVNAISGAVATVSSISADVQTVAGDSPAVQEVASISGAVTNVSGISGDVTNVSGISADVVAVAAAIPDIQAAVADLPSLAAKANLDGTNIEAPEFRSNLGLDNIGLFVKVAKREVAFTRTGNGTVSVKAGTIVEVDGEIYTYASAEPVTMPTLTAGTDYAIWIRPDGQPVATTDFVAPPVANSRLIGGFHYAPGGAATGLNTGGNTTAQINPFSLWDLKFRPACPDPRGMTLVAGKFWCDIYLLGVDHHLGLTSRYNVTIADGSPPPKVPAMFGGNGSTAYSNLNWWVASEVMMSHGKQLLDYAEFAAAMFGTKEAQSSGTDPVSTILRAEYTSIWGVMLASGNLWVWGRDFGGGAAGASWAANTDGRGSTYQMENVALFGGSWGSASYSGSRASSWGFSPTYSTGAVGARGRSDHLNHE